MEASLSIENVHENVHVHENVNINVNAYANDFTNHDSEIINMLELNEIREIIEAMSKFNQVEILKIFCKDKSIIINENKYGIHINLTEIKLEIVNELKAYINYVNTQEIQLHKIEKQKESFINTYFPKDNKDNLFNNR
jgi:hypothetical protein